MMVPNFSYNNSFYFLYIIIIIIIVIIIIIIILIFLPPFYFWLGGDATEPTISQHLKAKFNQHIFSY